MNKLAREGLLGSLTNIDLPICEFFLARKATRKLFGKATRSESPLQIAFFDICVLMSVRARHRAMYFIIFIDDYSCFGHVYLISHKDEVLDCFRSYLNLVENQLDKRIKVLRTDHGCEYPSE